jgi:hypothetical protein
MRKLRYSRSPGIMNRLHGHRDCRQQEKREKSSLAHDYFPFRARNSSRSVPVQWVSSERPISTAERLPAWISSRRTLHFGQSSSARSASMSNLPGPSVWRVIVPPPWLFEL